MIAACEQKINTFRNEIGNRAPQKARRTSNAYVKRVAGDPQCPSKRRTDRLGRKAILVRLLVQALCLKILLELLYNEQRLPIRWTIFACGTD